MKTIDKYIIKQFVGPFVVTFFIALFVLMMQFIWVYVDDMVGKGAGFGLVLEIIIYNCISLIPWALPIAILISSVMLLGNLGERYELASLKSAGVSLFRVMMPMLLFAIGISIFSFICSNNLVPIANLKFKSRLHDLRTQKPTLNLEEGVFNTDFNNFIIHIGKKEKDDRTIRDVIIYDHKNYNKGKLSMITSESGEMFMTPDNRYFVMNLKNGYHYQDGDKPVKDEDKKYSFMRTKFDEWTKIFDTQEFDIDLTDMDRFKNHYTMKSVNQLWTAIDSLDNKLAAYDIRLDEYMQKNFTPTKKRLDEKKKVEREKRLKEESEKMDKARKEKAAKRKKEKEEEKKKKPTTESKTKTDSKKTSTKKDTKTTAKQKAKSKSNKKTKNRNQPKNKKAKATQVNKKDPKAEARKKAAEERKKKKAEKPMIIEQVITKDLKEYDSFFEIIPEHELGRFNLITRANTTVKGTFNQAESVMKSIKPRKESRVKHVFVLYSKFTFAIVCCVFLFIGAPMGAIVKKGGFGYPLLIAILFFMSFIILNILFQKLSESNALVEEFSVWCPLLIMIPVGAFLTERAMNDKSVFSFGNIFSRIGSFFQSFRKKKEITTK